ncbi:hypothetical protein [Sulfobacillus thermosulfidooxidans]|uniref:hypothetical protein n=1 Tax=Sulfobacillus thermosulfidooxidans TaxID=28034 RepID=UPI0006B622FB|nr:hypothetical protein [Sulfobacillus thermosulfidooxidans]
MCVRYRVVREHSRSDVKGLRLYSGEMVSVGRRDTDWSSWLWCTTESGQGAWVPEQFLHVWDDNRAVVTTDYDSTELTVSPGDLVTGTQIVGGWVWSKNSQSEEGWVPLENLTQISEPK